MCECVFVCVFEMMTEKEVLLRAVVVFFIFFQVTHYVCKSLYSVHQKTYFEILHFFFFFKGDLLCFFFPFLKCFIYFLAHVKSLESSKAQSPH